MKPGIFMVLERITPAALLASLARTIFFVLAVCFSNQAALAQSSRVTAQPSPSPDNSATRQSDQPKKRVRDPIENADEFKSKLTLGIYFTPGARAYDLNLRHQFGPLTAWIAGFYDPKSNKLMRVGAQYDYRKRWLHIVPSLEVSTTKAMAGSLSSELGSGKTVVLAGVSRTNLRPFFDLFWDPGDSVQLGIAHRLSSYDRISAFTIFDVRLHTQQQNTHVLWRHKLNRNNGITFDGLFKSGHTESGEFIRNVGIGVYYDRPKWFWKLYYDPHVNFTNRTMVRSGIGLKF
jgi:hypothetical protein